MTELQTELAETIALVTDDVRANGHDPHPWTTNALDSHTACRSCGWRFTIRVRSAGVTIQRGRGRCPAN
jgi:hypothetical protein